MYWDIDLVFCFEIDGFLNETTNKIYTKRNTANISDGRAEVFVSQSTKLVVDSALPRWQPANRAWTTK